MTKLPENYCFSCKRLMSEVGVGGQIGRCYICVNKECQRFGLLSVIGYSIIKKEKDELSSKITKK